MFHYSEITMDCAARFTVGLRLRGPSSMNMYIYISIYMGQFQFREKRMWVLTCIPTYVRVDDAYPHMFVLMMPMPNGISTNLVPKLIGLCAYLHFMPFKVIPNLY